MKIDSFEIAPMQLSGIDFKGIAQKINSAFFFDRDELQDTLKECGFESVDHLMIELANRIISIALEITDLDTNDLKEAIYKIAANLDLNFTQIESTNYERIKRVIFKIARILIHDFLFSKENVASDPEIAYSNLNLIKRTITSISITEGFSKNEFFDLLMLEEIDIPLKSSEKIIEYLVSNIPERDLDAIAKALYVRKIIRKKSCFVKLVTSRGKGLQPLKVDSANLPIIVHLFFCMHKPMVNGHRPFIKMNKGKGVWKFLQQNIVNEQEEFLTREIRKMSSEINSKKELQYVRDEVNEILDPIYKKHSK